MSLMNTMHHYSPRPTERGQYIEYHNSNRNGTRCLRKNELGGVIFECSHNTMGECLSKHLFGGPASYIQYVLNIEPGLPIFLFNHSDRNMHGIFEAATPGQMNINPYAWTDGSEKTKFPAQVRVSTFKHCDPVPEEMYLKVINRNYYTPNQFYFELDHTQAAQLICLFESHLASNPISRISSDTPIPQNFLPPISTNNGWQEKETSTEDDLISENHVNVEPRCSQTKSSSMDKSQSGIEFDSKGEVQFRHSWVDLEEEENKMKETLTVNSQVENEVEHVYLKLKQLELKKGNSISCMKGEVQIRQSWANLEEEENKMKKTDNGQVENEVERVYLKLKQLELKQGSSISRMKGPKKHSGPHGLYVKDRSLTPSPSISKDKNEAWFIVSELVQEVEKLKASVLEGMQKTTDLEEKLAISISQVAELKERVKILHARSIPSSAERVDV